MDETMKREKGERGWVGWGRSELWGIVYIRMGTEGACLRWKTKTPGIICPRRGASKLGNREIIQEMISIIDKTEWGQIH